LAGQYYVHRAVIVPGKRRGRVFASIEEAPAKVRKVFENGSVVTIIIADREAQQRIDELRRPGSASPAQDFAPGLAREALYALALIATLVYFALSR
jgi:hypothetical protein